MGDGEIENWIHDRTHVVRLQHAHADHIETMYRAMSLVAGNPAAVVVEHLGGVRTFIARGDRLENRAIFNGAESTEHIDTVLRHFYERGANCVIEVNPANYYVNPPTSWEQRLLPHLLKRGCRIDGFRCVWVRGTSLGETERDFSHRWKRFENSPIEGYAAAAGNVDRDAGSWDETDQAAESAAGKSHYVGYVDDTPAAVARMFVAGPIAYLTWGFTAPAFRQRGLHGESIRRRLRDAKDEGCTLAFSVTDFNFASPTNLQRAGFSLAYNYLLVRRDPLAI